MPEPDVQPSTYYNPIAQRGWSALSTREPDDNDSENENDVNDSEQLLNDNNPETPTQEPYMRASKAVSMDKFYQR